MTLRRLFTLAALTALMLLLLVLGQAAATSGDTVADRVLGQGGSFTTGTANLGGISATSLDTPTGAVVDAAGHLYVADYINSRVLEYDSPLSSSVANRVFGQAGSFTTNTCNNGGISASSLCNPFAVALDATGRLYIADAGNNRVLEYDSPLTSSVANRVFGQAGSFTSGTCNTGGVSSSSLCIPIGVAMDAAGHLYISDYNNSRVLEYDSPLTSSVANRVFGQGGSFTSLTCNLGGTPSASSLCLPSGAAVDAAGRLYVADYANSRVLEYDSPLTSSVANRVFGQGGSFTTNTCNNGGTSASSLCYPYRMAVDAAGHLYISDYNNSRVLEYDSPLTSSVANRVFGQGGSFTTSTCNNLGISASSLCFPYGVAVDSAGDLYVADGSNNRVLEYDSPVPKPTASGTLSGVYDFQLSVNAGATSLFQCVYRLDQYASGGTYADGKTAIQCYATDGNASGDPNGLPRPGSYPAIGPPPPPPYIAAAPAKGVFSVTAGPVLTTYICFPNIGGPLGPNVISRLTISDPLGQLNTNGKQVGDVNIYPNQGITQCDSVLAGSPSPAGAPIVYAGAGYAFLTDSTDSRCAGHGGGCVLAPWRSPSSPTKLVSTNFCTDSDRLWQNKPGTGTACGDDPWNPNDVENSSAASGLYTIQATFTRADACWGGTSASNPAFCVAKADATLVPGLYFTCDADILQGTQISPLAGADQLLTRTLCYIDGPSLVVNADAVPGYATTCPSAAAQYCGDGLLGAAPPGCTLGSSCAGTRPDQAGGCVPVITGCQPTYWQFAHIHLASGSAPHHTELTGTVDTGNNLLSSSGCFVADTSHSYLGNVYTTGTLNLQTGHGNVAAYISQTLANCLAGTPTGAPVVGTQDAVRQATDTSTPSRYAFDSDGDGCPDVSELSANPATGGLRDPYNPYDYFDATHDGRVRVNDILTMSAAYFHDEGTGGYSASYDRTGIAGSNIWNLGPGDGLIRISDILAEIKQAFHDCPSTSPAP